MSKRNKTIIIIIAILGYVIYAIYCELAHNKIIEDGKYTVAKVTDFKTNFKNGYTVYYQYNVFNQLYSEKMHVSQDYNNIIGKSFYAKFNPERPKDCFIILDKPVSSKNLNPPKNGWNNIPN